MADHNVKVVLWRLPEFGPHAMETLGYIITWMITIDRFHRTFMLLMGKFTFCVCVPAAVHLLQDLRSIDSSRASKRYLLKQ